MHDQRQSQWQKLYGNSPGNYEWKSPYYQEIAVNDDDYVIHPDYDDAVLANDIAVVNVKTKFNFGPGIRPICLARMGNRGASGDYPTGISFLAAGWGLMSNGSPATRLQQVILKATHRQVCNKEMWNELSDQLKDTELCADGVKGGKDTCMGDSGGPLMIRGQNRRWVLAGVTSYGVDASWGCGKHPAVYQDVAKYRTWIMQNMRKN